MNTATRPSDQSFPWKPIALGIFICLGAGFLGNLLSGTGVQDWFLTPAVIKPPWNPPSWVFAPVWTVLYILMGVSAGLVWARGFKGKLEKSAFVFFWIQLALNVLWCLAFFGFRSPTWGYAVIFVLWFAIVGTIWTFSKIRTPAGLLLLPYLAWVTFASTLNYWIMQKNVIDPQVEAMRRNPANAKFFKDQKETKDKSIFAEPERPVE